MDQSELFDEAYASDSVDDEVSIAPADGPP